MSVVMSDLALRIIRLSEEEQAHVQEVTGPAAEEIITRYGWPFRSVIGESAAMHLSALVAHADERNTFRRTALEAMSAALKAGEADPRHFAHIYDRTCAVAREPQLYGSLIAPKDGEGIVIWPVQDPQQLDARRRGIGLPSLTEDLDLYRRGAVMGPFMVPTLTARGP